jgi:hypothetical protein
MRKERGGKGGGAGLAEGVGGLHPVIQNVVHLYGGGGGRGQQQQMSREPMYSTDVTKME